jgi:hypothetical protein
MKGMAGKPSEGLPSKRACNFESNLTRKARKGKGGRKGRRKGKGNEGRKEGRRKDGWKEGRKGERL